MWYHFDLAFLYVSLCPVLLAGIFPFFFLSLKDLKLIVMCRCVLFKNLFFLALSAPQISYAEFSEILGYLKHFPSSFSLHMEFLLDTTFLILVKVGLLVFIFLSFSHTLKHLQNSALNTTQLCQSHYSVIEKCFNS